MSQRLTSSSRIYVAGHRGMVGSAIERRLVELGCRDVLVRTSAELDLRDNTAVDRFFETEKPEFVFLAAAKVGGIMANALQPAEFLYHNLAIQTNVIHSAWKHSARKLVFLGSSCIYPKMAPQPIKESSLLTGPLEESNEAYAIAKIAGLKMAAAYRAQYGFQAVTLMLPNLYGPGDNFDLKTSHVLPALIRRFYEAVKSGAKEVVLWGTGTPRREFLHVSDAASAACFAMEHYDGIQPLNAGTGEDVTIADLAQMVARVAHYKGHISFDPSKPDGTPRKVLDVSRIEGLGWRPHIALEDGIVSLYQWYVSHAAKSMAG